MHDATTKIAEDQLDSALLESHLQQRWQATAISALAILVCYVLLYHSRSGLLLNIWVAAALAILLGRALCVAVIDKVGSLEKQIQLQYVLVGLSGAVWGSLCLLWKNDLALPDQLIIVLFPLAMTVGAVLAYGTWLPAFYCFAGPAQIPMIIVFITSGATATAKIALPALCFMVVQVLLARSYHSQLRHSLELKLLNERLVSNLSAHNAELLKAQGEANAANVAKNEFLARMSHEIRTPINGVMGMADMLSKSNLDNQQAKAVANLRTSGDTLLSLINELLDVSTLESGNHELVLEDFDLHQLLHKQVLAHQDKAEAKGLTVELSIADQVPVTINGDTRRLQQILTSLIGNAIKFSERGEINLTVDLTNSDQAGKCIRYAVADNGVGIEPEHQSTIFDVFQQGDGSITRRFGGSGLGLSIAKSFTELMDGHISVASTVGIGSTFFVDIPMRLATNQLVENSAFENSNNEANHGSPARVLVAEDNPINQTVITAMLEGFDCDVTLVENGEEALQAIAECEFDIVFMDCQMPVMDGLSATQTARERGDKLPIVAVTANVMKGDRERCLAAGMNDYVSKPLVAERLHVMLSNWVYQHGQRTAAA
jgi:signal transduction histidine kinase/ActR/RegA family two-component response regulator